MTGHLPRTHEAGNCMDELTGECIKPNKNTQSTIAGKGIGRSSTELQGNVNANNIEQGMISYLDTKDKRRYGGTKIY